MTKRQHILTALIGALAGLLVTGCEKEIDIDYRDSSGMYVCEAQLSQNGANVRLTTTQPVTENSQKGHIVTGAMVVLSTGSGEVLDTLGYNGNGNYRSAVAGVEGETYQIDIDVDGHHFSSQSTMQQAAVVDSFRFVWKSFFGKRILFADLRLKDIPRQQNCYFMHIYRNGIGYRWAVMTDEQNPGGELQQLFSCTTEDDMKNNNEDALRDGDAISVEVRSIDRRSYDYLYSLQVMDNGGTNPVSNFSGGCLGYFSAYHMQNLKCTFSTADVESE